MAESGRTPNGADPRPVPFLNLDFCCHRHHPASRESRTSSSLTAHPDFLCILHLHNERPSPLRKPARPPSPVPNFLSIESCEIIDTRANHSFGRDPTCGNMPIQRPPDSRRRWLSSCRLPSCPLDRRWGSYFAAVVFSFLLLVLDALAQKSGGLGLLIAGYVETVHISPNPTLPISAKLRRSWRARVDLRSFYHSWVVAMAVFVRSNYNATSTFFV